MSDTTSVPAFFLKASFGRRIAPSSSALCAHISPCVRVLGIHGVTACHKGDHTTGTNLIQSLGKEIVVDGKSQLVIRLIGHFVVAERDIAHSQIVEVSAVCRFKTGYLDFCIGIELLSNSAGDGTSSTPYKRLLCISGGSIPKKLPIPIAGSRIFPVSKPICPTAS